MVETIAPVVYEGKRSRYFAALAVFACAALLAAGLVGLLAGTLGAIVGAPWGSATWIAVAAAAVIYALRDVFHLPIPIPDRHRQVPQWWRSFYSQRVTAWLYGFGLGIGYLTYLSFGTYFVVTIAAFATGDPVLGAAFCAPFGVGRALSVVAANGKLQSDRASGIDRIDDLATTAWPRIVNSFVLIAVAGAAVVAWRL